MADVYPTNNLPPGAQAWARKVERSIDSLTTQVNALQGALRALNVVVTNDITTVDTASLKVGQMVAVI